MLKIIFLKIKKINLIYFKIKNILKNIYYYTFKNTYQKGEGGCGYSLLRFDAGKLKP
jgi:hypothetical protein